MKVAGRISTKIRVVGQHLLGVRSALATGFSVALALGRAHAEAPPARAVTLAEVQAAALAAPAHRAAAVRADAAEAAVGAAGAWPAFSVGVATTISTAHAIVTASVPLPVFGTIGAARDAARADRDAARAETAAVALDQRLRL